MNLVKEVEEKISQMSSSERAELIEWIDNFQADEWDKQIESDILAGRLDKITNKAREDYKNGKVSPL